MKRKVRKKRREDLKEPRMYQLKKFDAAKKDKEEGILKNYGCLS